MAISYPRSFPSGRFAAVDFELDEAVSQNILDNGGIQARQFADPLWRATFTTVELYPADPAARKEIGLWRAWWASLRGAMPFYAYDPSVRYPANHPGGAGLGGWGGLGGVSAIAAHSLTASGVNSGLTVEPGDYVSLSESGRRALFRITEAASASGSSIALSVEPHINLALYSTSAISAFVMPTCIMVPVPGSFHAPQGTKPAPIRFQGVQKLV